MYFNYWNDDFYKQWNHQLLFSITEMVSTIMVVYLLDRRTPSTPRKLLAITSIAIFHVLAGGIDQFVSNVIKMKGALHQTLRDIGFMVPDVMHVVLPLYELRQYARNEHMYLLDLISRKDIAICFVAILLALLICHGL